MEVREVPVNEPYDWVDDASMSAEETRGRFEALGPKPTTGPPAGNYVFSWGAGVTVDRAVRTDAAYEPRTHREPLTAESRSVPAPLR
jgi:hypothetical protein